MNAARNENSATPPEENEIEISLFGPCYGESALVHLGAGDWMVVDSCLDKERRAPAALSHLRRIGADPTSAVKLIVATHWHDDHIRGLSQLVRACDSARFSCSQALRNEDFLALVHAARDPTMKSTSGLDEFESVISELKQRNSPPVWALANRLLWRREGEYPCQVWALSPSDRLVTKAFESMGRLLADRGSPKKRIPAPERNDGSVVIWISVADKLVLLGADLEYAGTGTGWSAVVASPNRPTGRAGTYKVAHHGSESGDSPEIWNDLLSENPVAILTPFSLGSVDLPTTGDIHRLRERTPHVFATAQRASQRASFGSGSVGRTKREVLKTYRKLFTGQGHIRIRMKAKEPTGFVDLFGDAVALGNPRGRSPFVVPA